MEPRPRAEVSGYLRSPDPQLGRREVGRERHRPRADHPVELAVESPNRLARDLKRLSGLVGGHVERVVHVRDLRSGHDSTSRLPVGVQAGVYVLGAARIDERSRAVLEQLRDCQQRGQPLLLCGHHALEREHVGKIRGAEIVREYAARGVRVAYVHVPADETRCDYEVARVNGLSRLHALQVGGLADRS